MSVIISFFLASQFSYLHATYKHNLHHKKSIVLFKDDGKFDEEGAFNSLVETYGQEKENIIAENGDKKKRKVNPKEAPSGEDDDEKAKKAKLSDTFKVSEKFESTPEARIIFISSTSQAFFFFAV